MRTNKPNSRRLIVLVLLWRSVSVDPYSQFFVHMPWLDSRGLDLMSWLEPHVCFGTYYAYPAPLAQILSHLRGNKHRFLLSL